MPDNNSIIIRPIGQMLQALSRYSENLYEPPSQNIRGIEPESWYSPLQPVQPIAPEGTEARGFQFWAGQNLLFTPRADAEYSAADLKYLATYPLARICIENVKDSIAKTSWEIQARTQLGETKKQRATRSKDDENILKLNKFFEYPDREHCWTEWIRPLLDDMLVIDAATILIRKTFKGEIVELPVLRGDSIVRYIDANGWTPMPPDPAYAQNWWGIPLVNLTTDQLVYKPRNIVPRNTIASQMYGMSPTEQLAEELKVGIQRLAFTLAYYTEGSIPGVIQVVPKGTSPDKIAEAMQWMNSELAGNLAARRQWRLVQGFNEAGKDDQIEFTKEALLTDAFDELHIRKVCFAYGTSPQRLMRMMGTRNAESQQEAADMEGLLPWLTYLKGIIDYIIQRKFNLPDYEIVFNPFREPDQEKESRVNCEYVKTAVLTPNEARERIGEEPSTAPEANMLGTIGGQGFIPIGLASAQAQATTDDKGNTTVKPNGKEGKDGTANSPKDGGGEDKNKPPTDAKGKPNGKPNGKEAATATQTATVTAHSGFGAVLDGPTGTLIRGSASSTVIGKKRVKAPHRIIINPTHFSPQATLARRTIEHVMHNHLASMERKVITQLEKSVSEFTRLLSRGKKMRKGAKETAALNKIMKQIASEWKEIPAEVSPALEQSALAGVMQGMLQLHITDADMLSTVNEVAQEWATERAAEMVGMRRLEDGSLIENPDAKWAISDSTRENLRTVIRDVFEKEAPTLKDIEKRVMDSGIFSDTRASMIARTEVSRAESEGNLETWRQSGLVETVEWEISGDHDHDDECDENEGNSPYDVDEVPDFPAHPNCDCVLVIGEISEE